MKNSPIIAIMALLLAATPAKAATLWSDSFSTPYGIYNAGDSLAGWTVDSGSVAVINCSAGYDPCLAMDYVSSDPADNTSRVTSTAAIGFNAGQTYGISVVTALGGGVDSWTISLGSFFSKTYSQSANISERIEFTPLVDGFANVMIDLFGTGGQTYGPYITRLVVDGPDYVAPETSTVPLPASFLLLLGTLIGGVLAGRRAA